MTRKVIYGWRPGSYISIDAQKAGEELEKLKNKINGLIEPDMVVDAARSEASALHDHFEWDDQAAAAEHRREQARELVRCLTVDISHSNLETKPVRAFVNVESGGERGYLSTFTAMSSRELRKQVLEKAWQELESWRKRHAELTELARIFSMVDAGIEALSGS